MRYLFKLIVAPLNPRNQGGQVIHLIIKNIFYRGKTRKEDGGAVARGTAVWMEVEATSADMLSWRGVETSRTSPQHFSKDYSAQTFIGNTLEVFTVQENLTGNVEHAWYN